ncbi:MAG: anthranilate synthase component I [Bacteroidetes bacterium QS_9_68_14]|nr:MAG: anthranilate synthase component I [Bacteroidetes bacterium QS_9_68_14]
MSFDAFQRHVSEARGRSSSGRVVAPIARRRSADLMTPVAAFLALRSEGAAFPFLLESVEGGEKLARYSFLGKDPYRVLRAEGSQVAVEERRAGVAALPEEATSGNVFDALRALTTGYTAARRPGLPRLAGGAVGYLGYDTVRLLEDLPDAPGDSLSHELRDVPDAIWAFYDQLVAFDHARHQVVLIQNVFLEPGDEDLRAAYDEAGRALDTLEADLHRPAPTPDSVTLAEQDGPGHAPPSNVSRAAFEDAVRAAKKHIRAGDIFQVVLSQRLEMNFTGDRFNLYRALRQVNPSPYLFYLDFEDFALVGASPEVLVRVEPPPPEAGGHAPPADGKAADRARAELLPIAGTRPRGEDEAEDRALASELSGDEKERAEHLMLVDLGRNDLSRVCRPGTVEVERYAFVERYSHVMHLVSEVAGRLRAGQDAIGALKATFPAGTVSGAPKVRAMQIIDRLEPERRGVYAGAVGHLGFDGALDTCIAIRTMVAKDQTAHVQAGAGIVADSDPTAEYEETLSKAQALREAVRMAAEKLF